MEYDVNKDFNFSILKSRDIIKFKCEQCGIDFSRIYSRFDKVFLCKKCKLAFNNLKKYGVTNVFQLKSTKDKIKSTMQEKYGVDNVSQLQEIKDKKERHYIEKFGTKTPLANKEIQEKSKQTCLEKYGVENAAQSQEIRDKMKQTCLDRYGDENYNNPEKRKETCLEKYGKDCWLGSDSYKECLFEKYGVEYYSQTKEHRNKSMQTCLEKYGYPYYSQSPEAAHNRRKKYYYKGQSFDSSWELAYYVYNVDNNNYIIREPISIKYVFENKEHYYIPDFMVNGRLIEIKGPQFFKEGKMICPFDESLNDTFEAKHQCMIKNNVEIIMNCDKYIQYITEKYGQDFLENCKD